MVVPSETNWTRPLPAESRTGTSFWPLRTASKTSMSLVASLHPDNPSPTPNTAQRPRVNAFPRMLRPPLFLDTSSTLPRPPGLEDLPGTGVRVPGGTASTYEEVQAALQGPLQLAAVHHQVDHAVLQQELRPLE